MGLLGSNWLSLNVTLTLADVKETLVVFNVSSNDENASSGRFFVLIITVIDRINKIWAVNL